MSGIFSTFGALAFLLLLTIIFLLGREFLKLKKENTRLKSEQEAFEKLFAQFSPEELQTLDNINFTEVKEPCQKS